jgi:hypothetical protein
MRHNADVAYSRNGDGPSHNTLDPRDCPPKKRRNMDAAAPDFKAERARKRRSRCVLGAMSGSPKARNPVGSVLRRSSQLLYPYGQRAIRASWPERDAVTGMGLASREHPVLKFRPVLEITAGP